MARLVGAIALLLFGAWVVAKRTVATDDRGSYYMITDKELEDFPDREEWEDEVEALKATIGDCLQRIRIIRAEQMGMPENLQLVTTQWCAVVTEKLIDSRNGRFFGGDTPLVVGPDQLTSETKSLMESGWNYLVRRLQASE